MTAIILIVAGLILLGITIWGMQRGEADVLFWMDYLWWEVNRSDHPLLFRIAIGLQLAGGMILVAWGVIQLVLTAGEKPLA